ncbi:31755_t:CDS:2, partial [Gigaspora margarita]
DEKADLRPIMFDSRKLNKHKINYIVMEKECLALEWLFNKAVLKECLMRWVLALQAFEFKLVIKTEEGMEMLIVCRDIQKTEYKKDLRMKYS